MNGTTTALDQARRITGPLPRRVRRGRRGVSSVLSMMFLVLFGSLAAAMAVVAQGNLRTADSALKVSRALSAAETGLAFAARRLHSEGRRFITTRGVIDTDYAEDLWLGTVAAAEVDVLPPEGYVETGSPSGLLDALFEAHSVDADSQGITPEQGDETLPIRNDALGILWAPPIPVNNEAVPTYFRLKYEILADQPAIRVTSQGVDQNITRTLQLDFRIDKKIEFAVISPSRIMIGKNVRVEGPVGTRYGVIPGELSNENGDPLVMRSDFYYLDTVLDTKLDTFFTRLVDYDVDGDGRLRPDHPVEANGLGGFAYLVDLDGNEYVDDFDIFVSHYDANGDGRVVYDGVLSGGAEEFTDDLQLARLIDEAVPDRDGDGSITASDNALGYFDGALDINDIYAKVRGRLSFAVARSGAGGDQLLGQRRRAARDHHRNARQHADLVLQQGAERRRLRQRDNRPGPGRHQRRRHLHLARRDDLGGRSVGIAGGVRLLPAARLRGHGVHQRPHPEGHQRPVQELHVRRRDVARDQHGLRSRELELRRSARA
ncbi:MAG: EF-hand domain-containing protein [Planctomycetota bacterium]|jgi:hypothetical protein